MRKIIAVSCLYATKAQVWSIELKLEGGGTHRFPIRDPNSVEVFLENVDEADDVLFNSVTGDVHFLFGDVAEPDEAEAEDESEDEDEVIVPPAPVIEVAVDPEAPVKRKRGRPRKVPVGDVE